MPYRCENCAHIFDEAVCKDWRQPGLSFVCPNCDTPLVKAGLKQRLKALSPHVFRWKLDTIVAGMLVGTLASGVNPLIAIAFALLLRVVLSKLNYFKPIAIPKEGIIIEAAPYDSDM